ncbi:hypothetical protein [Microvirga vignae]|uniref:hypothetical protein n=1 Tax=Microvirga vignae TaxID=1225564 RepID=UPI001FCCD263|nr:hypothetical protein [Microvirga vignae]
MQEPQKPAHIGPVRGPRVVHERQAHEVTGERQHMLAGHGRERFAGVIPIPPGKQPSREEHLTVLRLHCRTTHFTQVAGVARQQWLMWVVLAMTILETVKNDPSGQGDRGACGDT